MLCKRKRRKSTKMMINSLLYIVGITSVNCFQPPVQLDHSWEHFSPSIQISQSNFHPVNFNQDSGTYHQQRALENQNEPIRRQFDGPSGDSFSKLSNPFEYQKPVGEQHQQQSLSYQRQEQQGQLAVPASISVGSGSKLTNPFEFVPEVIPEQDSLEAKTIPDYIKEIKDSYVLDGEDDEVIEKVPTKASTKTEGRYILTNNQTYFQPETPNREVLKPGQVFSSLPNSRQVLPNIQQVLPKNAQLWSNSQQTLPNNQQISLDSQQVLPKNSQFLPNEPLPTKREPSRRIVFPKDQLDVADRRIADIGRQPKVEISKSSFPDVSEPFKFSTNHFDEWVPLTVPFVNTRNQVKDLEMSASHQKLSNNNGYDRPLSSKNIKFLPERPSSNLIRFPSSESEKPWSNKVDKKRHSSYASNVENLPSNNVRFNFDGLHFKSIYDPAPKHLYQAHSIPHPYHTASTQQPYHKAATQQSYHTVPTPQSYYTVPTTTFKPTILNIGGANYFLVTKTPGPSLIGKIINFTHRPLPAQVTTDNFIPHPKMGTIGTPSTTTSSTAAPATTTKETTTEKIAASTKNGTTPTVTKTFELRSNLPTAAKPTSTTQSSPLTTMVTEEQETLTATSITLARATSAPADENETEADKNQAEADENETEADENQTEADENQTETDKDQTEADENKTEDNEDERQTDKTDENQTEAHTTNENDTERSYNAQTITTPTPMATTITTTTTTTTDTTTTTAYTSTTSKTSTSANTATTTMTTPTEQETLPETTPSNFNMIKEEDISSYWIPLTATQVPFLGYVQTTNYPLTTKASAGTSTKREALPVQGEVIDLPIAEPLRQSAVNKEAIHKLQDFLHKVQGDYESLIVLNTVPQLTGRLNLDLLDDLPTLGTIEPGQVLTQDQIFIFYTTLAELHKVLEASRARLDEHGPEQVGQLLDKTIEHNFQMLSFLLMNLIRSEVDSNRLVMIDDTTNSKRFLINALFLRMIFPFI